MLMYLSTLYLNLRKIIKCVWDRPVFKCVIINQYINEFLSSNFAEDCDLDKRNKWLTDTSILFVGYLRKSQIRRLFPESH